MLFSEEPIPLGKPPILHRPRAKFLLRRAIPRTIHPPPLPRRPDRKLAATPGLNLAPSQARLRHFAQPRCHQTPPVLGTESQHRVPPNESMTKRPFCIDSGLGRVYNFAVIGPAAREGISRVLSRGSELVSKPVGRRAASRQWGDT